MGVHLARSCSCLRKILRQITSWLPLALALPRTVDLSVAFSPRLLLPVKHTKALRGSFLELPTQMPFSMTRNGRQFLPSPDNFKLDYALSREQSNSKGGKMYIQDKVEEYADDIFKRLENGAVMYFCGLKGMMPGIQDMLRGVCAKKNIDYDEFIAKLKKAGQWRVEVY